MLLEAVVVLFPGHHSSDSSPDKAPSLAAAYLNRRCCVENVPEHFKLGWVLLGWISSHGSVRADLVYPHERPTPGTLVTR